MLPTVYNRNHNESVGHNSHMICGILSKLLAKSKRKKLQPVPISSNILSNNTSSSVLSNTVPSSILPNTATSNMLSNVPLNSSPPFSVQKRQAKRIRDNL